jgi:hypothetical protein
MRRPHDIGQSSDAITRLARVGRAALPEVDGELREAHVAAIRRARLAPPRTATRASRRRVKVFAIAGAMLVAVPSMAFAGVLPDTVQRAVSNAASVVGVHVPKPHASRAIQHRTIPTSTAKERAAAEQARRAAEASDDRGATTTGRGLGSSTRGTRPGRPASGERRGNRFGQVAGGPDKGQAGETHGHGSSTGHQHSTPTPPAAPTPTSPSPSSGDDHGAAGGGGDSGSSSHGGGHH